MTEGKFKWSLGWRWALFSLISLVLVWFITRIPLTSETPRSSAAQPRPMPKFRLQDVNGQWMSETDVKGKLKVFTFWASWCDPCVEEMPSLQKLYEKLKDKGLVVIGMNLEEETARDRVKGFLSEYGIKFPVLLDTFGDTANHFGVKSSIPHNFVVDVNEQIILEERSPRQWDSPKVVEWLSGKLPALK